MKRFMLLSFFIIPINLHFTYLNSISFFFIVCTMIYCGNDYVVSYFKMQIDKIKFYVSKNYRQSVQAVFSAAYEIQ